MKLFNVLALFLIISGVGFAQDSEKVYKAEIDENGVQNVEILGGEYFFEPNHIIVKVNVPVKITISKKSRMVPHNIVINETEAGMVVRENMNKKPKVIEFTPTKVGKFPFFCDKKLLFFKSHKEKGMAGSLEVIE